MNTHWILVADASRARVFLATGDITRLQVVHKLTHPSSRSRTQELVSDEAGRIDKGGRGVLSAMDPRTDPHEHEATLFAHTLANLLNEAATQHEFTRLTMVAPPHFLGLLKARISNEVQNRLKASVSKDLTRLEGEALLRHVQNSRS